MSDSIRVNNVPCPGCGECEHIHVAETFREGHFLACDVCGIHYADVAESTLPEFYERLWAEGEHSCEPYREKLRTVEDPDSLRRFLEKTPRFRWAQRRLAELARGARVFDIGCGEGGLLWAAKNLGHEVYGCDIAENAVRTASTLLDSENIFAGRVQDLAFPAGNFDCVMAFEVIEHLDDPKSLLSEAQRLLTADGMLIISTPNRHRLFAVAKRALKQPHSSTDYPPHHLTRWSTSALRRLIAQYFDSVSVCSIPYGFESPLARTFASALHTVLMKTMGQTLCVVARCPRHRENYLRSRDAE